MRHTPTIKAPVDRRRAMFDQYGAVRSPIEPPPQAYAVSLLVRFGTMLG